jgi:hypothetical protein
VNQKIRENIPVQIEEMPKDDAIGMGAMALFGEKYAENVRTISIGEGNPFSYELCGGTHVSETGDIGLCLITAEGSVASGIRRIEAVTGRAAYELVQRRFRLLKETAFSLAASLEDVPQKTQTLLEEQSALRKQIAALGGNVPGQFPSSLRRFLGASARPGFEIPGLIRIPCVDGRPIPHSPPLRRCRPARSVMIVPIAAVTEDLHGHAGELVAVVAAPGRQRWRPSYPGASRRQRCQPAPPGFSGSSSMGGEKTGSLSWVHALSSFAITLR